MYRPYIGQVTRKPGARIVHCLAGQCSIIIVLKPTLGAGLTRQAGNLQAFILGLELSEVPHLRSEQCVFENVLKCL